MSRNLKEQIKKIIRQHPGSVLFYHKHDEWSIYPPGSGGGDGTDAGLIERNDYHDKRYYVPELVAALAELLGVTVKSNRIEGSQRRPA